MAKIHKLNCDGRRGGSCLPNKLTKSGVWGQAGCEGEAVRARALGVWGAMGKTGRVGVAKPAEPGGDFSLI